MAKKQDQDKFIVRLPDGMRDRIAVSAERNGRSMNAEVVQALKQAFPEPPCIDELLVDLNAIIDSIGGPGDPYYHRSLAERLKEVRFRLEAGVDFDYTDPSDLLSPKLQEAYEINRNTELFELDEARKRWRAEEALSTGDIDRVFRSDFVFSMPEINLRMARNALSAQGDIGISHALRCLGLKEIQFSNPKEAAQTMLAAIDDNLERRAKLDYGED